MSISNAVPPGRSTRRISASAFTGSVKFLNAARQTTKSTLASSSGQGRGVAQLKTRLHSFGCGVAPGDLDEGFADVHGTHLQAAFGELDGEKSRAGATSSTGACRREPVAAMRAASCRISGMSLRVVRSYQRAMLPSMPIPL